MNLRQLEYLNALASERHFGRAAEVSHVSQPALSASIKKLEQELGVTLIQRSKSFDALTPEGAVLVSWSQRVVADVDALRDEASRLRGKLTGTLRLGAIPSSMPAMAFITEGLLRRNPAVDLEIRSLPGDEVVRLLGTQELDGGITYLEHEPLGQVLKMPLYDERYFLLTTEGDGRPQTMNWADLDGQPLCLLTPDLQHRRIVDAALAAAGVTASPRVQANDISALIAFVRSGYACVIAHPWLVLHGPPRGTSAVLLTPEVAHPVGLITAPLKPPAPLVRLLRTELAQSNVPAELQTDPT